MCETKKLTNTTPDMSKVENYYSKTIGTLEDNELQGSLEAQFDKYKHNISQYALLLKERSEMVHQEAVTQGALEAAQKDRSKWLILTVIFGMISAFVLIVSFLAPKAFWLFLFCAGVTAITGYMLNDSAKTIAKCQSTNSNRSEKEQEIFKLKSTIISSANIEDLL